VSDPSGSVAPMNKGHRSTDGNRDNPEVTRPQMCARDELDFLVPRRIAALIRADNPHRPAAQRAASANPIPRRRPPRVGPRS